MAETYDITYEGITVGTASKEKQGLYYKFCCRCSLPDDGLYRIHVACGQTREDLGICVPMENLFGMDKKIPAKRLGEGETRFELVSKDWKPQELLLIAKPEAEREKEYENEMQDERNLISESEDAPDHREEGGLIFTPVSESEPFEYLDRLETAIMQTRPDEIGILLQQ